MRFRILKKYSETQGIVPLQFINPVSILLTGFFY